MPVVGFYVKSISAERGNIPKGRIDINSTPKILSIKKSEIGLKKKEDSLEIEFMFTTVYEPSVAKIEMNGNLMYLSENVNDALKMWNKSKTVPMNVEVEVKNFLFRKCMTIGIDLSEDMGLPPPLFFPVVHHHHNKSTKQSSEENLRYIG